MDEMEKQESTGNGRTNTPEKTPIWEDVVIIASIITLWPAVLRWHTIFSRVAMTVALAVLIWILVRRIRRMNRAFKK